MNFTSPIENGSMSMRLFLSRLMPTKGLAKSYRSAASSRIMRAMPITRLTVVLVSGRGIFFDVPIRFSPSVARNCRAAARSMAPTGTSPNAGSR
jgi:hypothetical protein